MFTIEVKDMESLQGFMLYMWNRLRNKAPTHQNIGKRTAKDERKDKDRKATLKSISDVVNSLGFVAPIKDADSKPSFWENKGWMVDGRYECASMWAERITAPHPFDDEYEWDWEVLRQKLGLGPATNLEWTNFEQVPSIPMWFRTMISKLKIQYGLLIDIVDGIPDDEQIVLPFF